MRQTIAVSTAALLLSAAWAIAADGWPRVPERTLIYYGWGAPNSTWLPEHLAEIEAMPFDAAGVTIALDRQAWLDGTDVSTQNKLGRHLFGPDAFDLETFAPAIEELRTLQDSRVEPLLAACIVSQGQDFGFDWFDEERWQTALSNWRIFCQIARQGGCPGIIWDPEHYGTYFFNYPEMNQRHAASFEEYDELLRRRGREYMRVAGEVFPDLQLLMFWGNTYLALHPTQKEVPPPENAYGLLPSFFDGMLEGAHPATSFVDLCEFAYGYTERRQFLEAYHGIVNRGMAISALPDVYRARVRVGFGLWLDNGGRDRWNTEDFSGNHFTPDRWQQALTQALDVTDGYVWIYSHSPRFFPPANLPEEYLQAFRNARAAAGLDNPPE